AALRDYGIEIGRTDPRQAAEQIRSRPAALRDAVIAGLDNWIQVAEWFPAAKVDKRWLRAVVRDADPDPWRTRLREAAARKDRAALEALAHDPEVLAQWPATLTTFAHALVGIRAQDAAVDLLRRAQQQHPSDFWINTDLAWQLVRLQE